jgi:hypothetical protein
MPMQVTAKKSNRKKVANEQVIADATPRSKSTIKRAGVSGSKTAVYTPEQEGSIAVSNKKRISKKKDLNILSGEPSKLARTAKTTGSAKKPGGRKHKGEG